MVTICITPEYESPKWRFFEGLGEILIGSRDGPAATLWEVLIHCKDGDYPLLIEGEFFSKEYLLIQAAKSLLQIPDVVEMHVKKEGSEKIYIMCINIGIDPEDYL